MVLSSFKKYSNSNNLINFVNSSNSSNSTTTILNTEKFPPVTRILSVLFGTILPLVPLKIQIKDLIRLVLINGQGAQLNIVVYYP